MAFYKLCDCGSRNIFTHRGLAPRKCENCGRSLLEFSVVDEDDEQDYVDVELAPQNINAPGDLEVERFYYSLVALDNSGEITIPSSGGIVGRAALGSDLLQKNRAISREHISVIYRGRIGVLVEDRSKFGTFINGEQLIKGTPKFARDGDIIKLYNLEFQLRKHDEE